MPTYTADDLVTAVRRRAKRPSSAADPKISDADILALADEEMSTVVLPFVLGAAEEYYVTSQDYTIGAAGNTVRLPSRAVAAALRDVTLVYNGYETSLAKIEVEDEGIFTDANFYSGRARVGYVLKGDKLTVLPDTSNDTAVVRIKYEWRPGKLVSTSSTHVQEITSISLDTVVFFSSNNFSTTSVLDLVQAQPNFDLIINAESPSAAFATSVTFADASEGAAGDYVCTTGFTPIIHAPVEVHPILYSATTSRVLAVAGNYEAAQYEYAIMQRQMEQVQKLFDPRNKGEVARIIARRSSLRKSHYLDW